MINSAEHTANLPLQLFKEIVNPIQDLFDSTISDKRYIPKKEDDEGSKKTSTDELSQQYPQMPNTKGYIKYPLYEFF